MKKEKIVLLTRAKGQSEELKRLLKEYGLRAEEMPVIKILPPQDSSALDEGIRNIESYDFIVFTSVNGVDFFFSRAQELGASGISERARYAAVGSKTAAALKNYGIDVEIIPEKFTGSSVAETLKNYGLVGRRVLLPRADIARRELPEALGDAGAVVDEVVAYRTVIDDTSGDEGMRLLMEGEVDCIVFTSPSTVHNFMRRVEGLPQDRFMQATVACIGTTTAEAAKKTGFKVDIVPQEHTVEAIAEEIAKYMKPKMGDF
ncbi:MAG: uroporphyrinogen-III synthase [bacterium]